MILNVTIMLQYVIITITASIKAQALDDANQISTCLNNLKIYKRSFDLSSAQDKQNKHKTYRMLYYNEEYTIWQNNNSGFFYYVDLYLFPKEYLWNEDLSLLEHENVCKHIKDTVNIVNPDPYKEFTVKIMGIEPISHPLSAESLFNQKDPSYIGNFIDNYDGNDCEKRIEILKIIMKDMLNALNYLQRKHYVHYQISPSCIVPSKQNDQLIFKLLNFRYKKDRDEIVSLVKSNPSADTNVIEVWDNAKKLVVWSLGLTGLGLYLGNLHFLEVINEDEDYQLFFDNFDALLTDNNIFNDFSDFLHCCIQINTKKRSSVQELLQHKFLAPKSN